jgi:hypothetical protein
MNATLPCPGCKRVVLVPQQMLGKPYTCPSCGMTFFPPMSAAGGGSGGKKKAASGQGSSTKLWVLLGVGGVLLLVGGLWGVKMLTSGPDPAPVAQQPSQPASQPTTPTANPPEQPAPQPEPKSLELVRLPPLRINPGEKLAVDLVLNRNGAEGSAEVVVSGLPEGVEATVPAIDDGQSTGKLELAADPSLGDEELTATLDIIVTIGDQKAQQSVELTVAKLNLPTFAPVQNTVLPPGGSAVVPLGIERNGFQGPLTLQADPLPQGISLEVPPVAADATSVAMKIAVAPGTPGGQHSLRLATTVYGRMVEVSIPVQVDPQPYIVKFVPVVHVRPGESRMIDVTIQRRSYRGPVTLRAQNLPQGVTIPDVQVPQGATTAVLALSVAEDAPERVQSGQVVSQGGELRRSDLLIVRVTRGENGFLPRAVTADPELSRLLRRGSFGGRLTTQSKQALLETYGGNAQTEEAVLRGLRWLAAHQQEDGRWSLKAYHEGIDGCNCRTEFENEVVDMDTAGTAFGVLPFLGAGIAHNRAPEEPSELAQYQDTVRKALEYLCRNQVRDRDVKKNGNLGGNLYAHALGTIALCEAYGISGDDRLKIHAQMAIKYLTESQHADGGWRYGPRQPGDMSAVGWMFLAIRSGQLAGLQIDNIPLQKATLFVNSCAAGPEEYKLSRYAYQPGMPAKLSLSAAGLLTRQYLGWKQDDPNLLAGASYLMQNLPPASATRPGALYYYYYATQVLHHMEGMDWDLWNHYMREHLLRTQIKEGHATGSWDAEGADWGARGGRLYSTSLALMTLQVYYRHLPMYRKIIRTFDN